MAEDYKVPEHVARLTKRAEDALVTDKEKARRLFKLWAGILPRKRAKRSNLFIRKVFAFVENQVSRFVEAMFQYKPYFDLESRSTKYTAQADNAEAVLQYHLEQADLENRSIHWFKQSSIENIGVMMLGWRKVVRKQKQRVSLEKAIREMAKFELPPELEGKHVWVNPQTGEMAANPDDQSAMYLHEGDKLNDYDNSLAEAGFEMVTLDKAPPAVREQFSVVIEAPKVIYDGLNFEPIEFQDSFWDPDASFVEELRYAGHHCGKTLQDLKDEKANGVPYINLDKLEEWASAAGQIPDIARYRRRDDLGKSSSQTFDVRETLFRVTNFWHVQEGKLVNFVSTGAIASGYVDGIVIRDETWPFWHGELPYHYLPASIVPFEMIGVGPAEVMEQLQLEKNEIRNILMDGKVLAISPPWLYNDEVLEDPSKLDNMEPNKKIPITVDTQIPLDSVIKQVQFNPVMLQNAAILENSIDRDMEETTGISKASQGIPIGRRTTYSEQSLLSNEGNFRFKMQIRTIDNVFKRVAQQAKHLLYQYLDPVVEVRITGDDKNPAFVQVDRAELALDYDIFPASSSVESLANEMSQAQNMIQGYNSIRGSQMETRLKPVEFLREYFRKLGIKNVDRFIFSDEEIQQQQQAQAQAQAQPVQQQPPQQQQAPQEQPQQVDPEMSLIQRENAALMQGQQPPVTPDQNHELHIQEHTAQAQQLEQAHQQQGMPPEEAANDPRLFVLVQHVQQHQQMMGAPNG